MYDSKDILMRKTDVLPHKLISLSVKMKMDAKGASRPFYTRDERLALMKELGVRMYADSRYKCSTCGKTKGDEGVKQLSLCSRCSDVWYCGAECSKKGWKTGGHKQLCGRLPVEQPIKLTEMSINVLTSEMLTGVSIIDNTAGDSLLVLAKDFKT